MFTQNKAETLNSLRGKFQKILILPQFTIKQFEWKNDSSNCLKKLALHSWSEQPLIVRSSSSLEDCEQSSSAGHFSSYLNVVGKQALFNKINKLMDEYKNSSADNAVFIQPMLKDVMLSAVAFTKIPPSGAPYYVINYDDTTGMTDTVTSGKTNTSKIFYCHRSQKTKRGNFWHEAISLFRKLEHTFQNDALDIEFAMTQDHTLVLFQVRPLVIHPQTPEEPDLLPLVTMLKNKSEQQSHLLGDHKIYGIMPDWNPAELIGIHPKPLALSIFQELISDEIWAESRYQYGYRDVRGIPLILSFAGHPYVDVRASFNSFIPRHLNDLIAEKLINYYLDSLRKNPSHHDKVEFEIVISCFTFDLPAKLDQLQAEIPNFSKPERILFEDSLRTLTNRITHFEKGLWKVSEKQLSILQQHYLNISLSQADPLTKMRTLIQDGKKYGTLPFAGLARAAFIAMEMLRSLVTLNIIDLLTYQNFLQNIKTISFELTHDLHTIGKSSFLKKYGHLRPGTYDILIQRFDESADSYFDFSKQQTPINLNPPPFSLTSQQKMQINNLLKQHRIQHSAESLFAFITAAIKGREFAKFLFTKNISSVLQLIEEYGQHYGISREECAFLKIKDIFQFSKNNVREKVKAHVEEEKQKYTTSQQLHLPPLIFNEKDLFSFHLSQQVPTYVSSKRVKASITQVDDVEIKGKIVFIHSADPGYDWIFTKNIAGFVTCYGGANSHMTIRAAEMNLPAIIGAGQCLYQKWQKYKILDIDCANRKVTPIT